ncbi:C4-dicarboxylate ABC transporter [Solitalea longa]|uniref:C4-dicarboxylate ABC transporter n=1 Tax=Solitalea longa TaxID=2079460 RepID=A0A2S5A481_9SPHI|nr:anaerobic C4-dicarboxylate transporter family protein [Solitalea longa]POY37107.1 C4-dicarboxylate ABC transporter [Solitalea longa]
MIWLQLIVLLAMVLIGSHLKGIGLGLMGVLGMFIFVQFFGMKPAQPPGDIMLIILSIVTLSAALEAVGGLNYLVSVAENVIRSNPKNVTLIAPLVSFVLCLFAGTSHVIYSLLPIISDVAAKNRVRPERPLSVSVIACHASLTGSPMAACTAAFASILSIKGIVPFDIMIVCIPSCFLGCIAASLVMYKYGKELNDDPVFLEKMKDPEFAAAIDMKTSANAGQQDMRKAKIAVGIFAMAILIIVLGGSFPQLVPKTAEGNANFHVNADGTLKMVTIIEIISLSAAAVMALVTKTSADKIVKASLFTSMASALVSVFGVVWMAATFMDHNKEIITGSLGAAVADHHWLFAVAIFVMGILMFSQGATTKSMMPLGLALGLSPAALIAMFPAVNSFFVLPGYPTILNAIYMDKTGSTKIGNFVINHSFLLPGMVQMVVSISAGFLFAKLFGVG